MNQRNMPELLAPAGDMEKLKTAIHFGADAVYLAGKQYGLRAFAGNFTEEEMKEAVSYAHSKKVKVYVTLNIVAHNEDFEGMEGYLKFLEELGVDGVIVSDLGVCSVVSNATKLPIHISTQANITNKHTALAYTKLGAKRLILARELSVNEIAEIREFLPQNVELECFVHGAMCISYSGRCLLSNYLKKRDSNRGECVHVCRWEYTIKEKQRGNDSLEIQEDDRGTYILNSRDLCLIEHLSTLAEAGIASFKIEGRMKSPYYVANVVNAYRRQLDSKTNLNLTDELQKSSHRHYTTGFAIDDGERENLNSSMPIQSHEFVAVVLEDAAAGFAKVEMRNRFVLGEELEVLSPAENWNKTFLVCLMLDEEGKELVDAKNVQQVIRLATKLSLKKGDVLRKRIPCSP